MKRKITILTLFAAVFMAFSMNASAVTNTFDNGGGDNLWSNPLNWDLGHTPIAGEDVNIDDLCIYDDAADHTVVIGNLFVQAGAQLLRNQTTGQKNIRLTKSIFVYGTIGNGTTPDAIQFVFDGTYQKIKGGGNFAAYRMVKASSEATATLIVENDVLITYPTTNNAIYNFTKGTRFALTVESGYTFEVINGNIDFDGINGSTQGGAMAVSVKGDLIVGGDMNLTSDNTMAPTSSLVVANGGKLTCRNFITDACGSSVAAVTINLNDYSNVEFTGSWGWGNLSSVNRTYIIQPTATVEYSGSASQQVGNPLSGSHNIILSGDGDKVLTTDLRFYSGTSLEIQGDVTFDKNGFTYLVYSGAQLNYNSPVAVTTADELYDGFARNVTISNVGQVNLSADLDLAGDLTIDNGATFNTGAYAFGFQGANLVNNGTILGTSTLMFTGSSAMQSWSGNGQVQAVEIHNPLGVAHSGTTTVTDKFDIESLASFTNSGTLNIGDGLVFTHNGGVYSNVGTVNYAGTIDMIYNASVITGQEFPSTLGVINDLTINASVMLAGNATADITGTLTLNASLAAPLNNTVNVYTNIVNYSNFVPNSTTTFGVYGPYKIDLPNGTYGQIIIDNAGGADLTGNSTVAGDVTFVDGSLRTGANTITVGTVTNEMPGAYIVGNAISSPVATITSGTDVLGLSFSGDVTGTNLQVYRESGAGKATNTGIYYSINRTWKLTSDNSDIDLTGLYPTLKWVEEDRNSRDMSAAIVYEKTVGHTWNAKTSGAGASAITGTPDLFSLTADMTFMSKDANQVDFTVSDFTNALLPIELVAFNGQVANNAIELSWTTASEKNNDFFTVLKSVDGVNFEAIAVVQGAGNSSVEMNYMAIDNNPVNGYNYYILKQTDFDGTSTESEIIAVNYSNVQAQITISPNPVVSEMKISINSNSNDNGELVVLDMTGKSVFATQVNLVEGANTITVYPNLAKGTYFVTYKLNNQVFEASRILVK